MIWFNYVETVLLPLIIVAEIVALVVSNQQRKRIRNKHQMYLITALCVSELNGAFAAIVTHIIYGRLPEIGNAIMWFYIHTFSRLSHYSTMALLTIDRFLVFHLNIKYNAVWSPAKLLKILICFYVIAFLIFICFVYLIVSKLINWIYFVNIMFLPYFICDVLYIVLVIGTYFYIFRKYKKHMEMNKGQKNKANNKEHFKLLVSTLIIVTFILFSCVPDLVNSFIQFYNAEVKDTIFYILGVFYRIGWLVDLIIYVYYCGLCPKKKSKAIWKKCHQSRRNKPPL